MLIIVDILSIIFSLYGSLILRFEGLLEQTYISNINSVLLIVIILNIAILFLMKMYKSLWQFASVTELFNVITSSILCSLVNIVIFEIANKDLPEACYFLYFLLLTLCLGITRFSYRFIRMYKSHIVPKSRRELQKVMIIGAGLAGEKTYQEITYNPSVYKKVVCFIDDDKSKQGRRIHDVTVYGGREKIIEAAKKFGVEEILLAMPSRNKMSDKKIARYLSDDQR